MTACVFAKPATEKNTIELTMHTTTIIDENTTIKVAFMVSGTVTGGVLDGKSAFEEIHIIFIYILHHLYVDWINC